MDSKFKRVFSIGVDEYGIDPLLDKTLPLIAKIQTYKNHVVTDEEAGAPDLISMREYQTEDLWWVIMAYNGIFAYNDIVKGVNLKIPLITDITSIITAAAIRPNTTTRVITI